MFAYTEEKRKTFRDKNCSVNVDFVIQRTVFDKRDLNERRFNLLTILRKLFGLKPKMGGPIFY